MIIYSTTLFVIILQLTACSGAEFSSGDQPKKSNPQASQKSAKFSNAVPKGQTSDAVSNVTPTPTSTPNSTPATAPLPLGCRVKDSLAAPRPSIFTGSRAAPAGTQTAVFNATTKQGNITLSSDLLGVQTRTLNDTVLANIGKASGKWYFEIFVAKISACNFNAIGISALSTASGSMYELQPGQYPLSASYNPWGFLNGKGVSYTPSDSYLISNQLGYITGDVVGMAVDLDAHKIYYSLNGDWLTGASPASGGAGIYQTSELMYPAVNLSASDYLIANFGDHAFQYQAPAGFNLGWY